MLEVPDIIWYLFIIGLLFNALWSTFSVIYRALNQPYRFAVYSLISSLVSITLSYVFANPLGLIGVVIGYLIMDIIMTLLVIPHSSRLINSNWKSILMNK